MTNIRLNVCRTLSLLVLTGTSLLLWVGTSPASSTQESLFRDDNLLQYNGDAVRQQTLDTLKGLGVTTIQLFATWRDFVPNSDSTTKPSNFNGADTADYGDRWNPLDAALHAMLTDTAVTNQDGTRVMLHFLQC